MLYGLLLTLLIFVCFLLIVVILIQQGKGGLGLGSLGGGAQMLFGGSGGQDIFQKITWMFGAIFMFGSLLLFLLGSKGIDYSRYLGKKMAPVRSAAKPALPKPAMPQTAKAAAPLSKGTQGKSNVAEAQ